MSQEQTAITDMQCWVFRKAQRKWRKTPQECVQLFRQFDIMGYIRDCYDILLMSSYDRALQDVEEILHQSGVQVLSENQIGDERKELCAVQLMRSMLEKHFKKTGVLFATVL